MGGKENSKITDLCEFKASPVYTEFQNIQGYIVSPSLKQTKTKIKLSSGTGFCNPEFEVIADKHLPV